MDSSSAIQFQGLNRCSKLSTATTMFALNVEPKLEPFEEPLPSQHLFHTPNPCHILQSIPTATPVATSNPPSTAHSSFKCLITFHTAVTQGNQNHNSILDLPNSNPNSGAVVFVSNLEPRLPIATSTPRGSQKYQVRSSEIVRMMDLKPEDQYYYRNLIRRTRMIFVSLCVFEVEKNQKNNDLMAPHHRRPRADLKAAALMRECGLWLYRDKRIVGEIPGVSIGDIFFFRIELCIIGLHRHPQAGIDYVPSSRSSNGEPIATSIILSGGYEDNEDSGDMIIYTGHGGQDKHHRQFMHQKLGCGNLALERSMHYGVEVRVIRGFKYDSNIGGRVYVYDGLYKIKETWFDVGRLGFGVFKFKLVRNENQGEMGSAIMKLAMCLRRRPLDVRPQGYVTHDLSNKKEKLPVLLYNDIDGNHDPFNYDYIITSTFPPHVYSENSNGCDCVGGCLDNCLCARKNRGEFAYDLHGSLVRGKPMIFECGPHCRCPPTCRNRVTQKGVKNRLEVFRSNEAHWGVRSLDLIQAGSFICEYVGVVLTHEQVPIFTMNGDNLIYPSRFVEKWKEWGDLSQVLSNYVCLTHPSIPPLECAMDESIMRNVACYMSHSSTPNVLV